MTIVEANEIYKILVHYVFIWSYLSPKYSMQVSDLSIVLYQLFRHQNGFKRKTYELQNYRSPSSKFSNKIYPHVSSYKEIVFLDMLEDFRRLNMW